MIQKILTELLARFASWLFSKGLEYYHGQQEKKATEEDIDEKLLAFKEAYKGAFDGTKLTPEQRKNLNRAVSDFIRNSGSGGL